MVFPASTRVLANLTISLSASWGSDDVFVARAASSEPSRAQSQSGTNLIRADRRLTAGPRDGEGWGFDP